MPVAKCSGGKWRIGSGPCRYSSKEKAEKAWAGAKAAGVKSATYDEYVKGVQFLGRKYTKEEAGFSEHGMRALQCGECANFMPDSKTCALVEGTFGLTDVCNFFEPSPHIGDMSSMFAKSKTFDMFITKAAKDPHTGEKRWAAVASDTDEDSFTDRMSLELFNDFIERIEKDEAAPAVFASEAWQGGMPYLGLAHYLDLDGRGILGIPSDIYVDGNRLKAKGTFKSTPLGDAAFEAIQADRKNEIPPDERIRISIGFVDWKHAHESGIFTRKSLEELCPACIKEKDSKVYLKGQLVHLALTRVPVNERTPIWIEERAMDIKTIRDDAAAVLGEFAPAEELAELDELSKKDKKKRKVRYSSSVVIRADDGGDTEVIEPVVASTEEETEEGELVHRFITADPFGGATDLDGAEAFLKAQEKMYEIWDTFYLVEGVMINISEASKEDVPDKPAAVSRVISQFKERVDDTVKRSLAVRAAQTILKENSTEEGEAMDEPTVVETPAAEPVVVAPSEVKTPLELALEQFAKVVTEAAEQSDKPIEERLGTVQPAFNSLADVVKSTVKGESHVQAEVIGDTVASAIRAELAPLTEALTLLASKSAAPAATPATSMVPGPRAIQPNAIPVPGNEQPVSKLDQMVRKSVGLPD
jgi:hypothetical protein